MGRSASGELAGVVSAISAAVLWGTIGVVQRLAEEGGAETEMLIVGRTLGASLLSVPLLLYYRAVPTWRSVVIAVAALSPLYYSYMKAVSIIGAAISSLLLYTAPAWVAAASYLILGEKLGMRGVATVLMGVVGAALVSGALTGLGGIEVVGVMLGLASGATYALYIFLARYFQVKGATVLEVSLAPIAISGVILAALIGPSRPPNGVEVAASVYMALFTMILPYLLNVTALRYIEAHRVSVISLVEPLTAVVLAVLILGESLTIPQAVGGLMILSASLLVVRGK